MKVQINETVYGVSFNIICENLLAVAEISKIDKESFFSYCQLAQTLQDLEGIEKSLENCSDFYFFNRLNVPRKLRGQALGGQLLKSVLTYCNDKNIALINTANEYGDWTQEQLISFYEKAGMKLIHPEGLLIYHSNLTKKIKN